MGYQKDNLFLILLVHLLEDSSHMLLDRLHLHGDHRRLSFHIACRVFERSSYNLELFLCDSSRSMCYRCYTLRKILLQSTLQLLRLQALLLLLGTLLLYSCKIQHKLPTPIGRHRPACCIAFAAYQTPIYRYELTRCESSSSRWYHFHRCWMLRPRAMSTGGRRGRQRRPKG